MEREQQEPKENKHRVLLFYKFVDIEDPKKVMEEQRALCQSLGILGRILLAEEGINGTLEGTTEATGKYIEAMGKHELFAGMPFKQSEGNGEAFTKLKVKVRPEIVTLKAGKFDVKKETATEITVDELHELYKNNEDFVVLDLRNDYEIQSGYFEKTVDPKLENFRDLSLKIDELKNLKDRKIVSVCTGGIRCEKATCLLKREGFNNLYQLKDGIHTYMQKYPGEHFKGTLFVFDNRMVTDVVETPKKEMVGRCVYCGNKCETYYSNDTYKPSRKVICCDSCYLSNKSELRTCLG
jgi:UPF0176 protein